MTIGWNHALRLVVADVDDTLAPPFRDASAAMIDELAALLSEGTRMLLVSGAAITGIGARVVSRLPARLRRQILVAHCNGAEIFGFDEDGEQLPGPLFSAVTPAQRGHLRHVAHLVEVLLKDLAPGAGGVIVEDRGVQVSLDFADVVAGRADGSVRQPVLERANELLRSGGFGVEARLGGSSAVDFVLPHVDKGQAVRAVLGAELAGPPRPHEIEVWGDQFSLRHAGADAPMAWAVPQDTRVISFRDGPVWDVPAASGMRIWPGPRHLDEGVLDHLQSRGRSA